MILDFLVNRLEQSQLLKQNLFPVGVNIDEIYSAENDFSFTVYTFRSRVPEYDLEGNLHHYSDEVIVDFIGRLYGKVHSMYDAAEAVLTVCDLDAGTGEYIHHCVCSNNEPDAFDVDYGLIRRSMLVKISWAPL